MKHWYSRLLGQPQPSMVTGVVALTRGNGNGQAILRRRHRAAIIDVVGAVRAVGVVEIDDGALCAVGGVRHFHFEIATSAVAVVPRGGVLEGHEELVRMVLVGFGESSESEIAVPQLEA